MFKEGDLVRIIAAPDQDKYFMKYLIGKLGIVVEKVSTPSSPNIWKILIIETQKIVHLHKLDLEKIK